MNEFLNDRTTRYEVWLDLDLSDNLDASPFTTASGIILDALHDAGVTVSRISVERQSGGVS